MNNSQYAKECFKEMGFEPDTNMGELLFFKNTATKFMISYNTTTDEVIGVGYYGEIFGAPSKDVLRQVSNIQKQLLNQGFVFVTWTKFVDTTDKETNRKMRMDRGLPND